MPKLHPTAHHLLRLLTSSFCRPPTSFAPCPLSSLPLLLRLQLAQPPVHPPRPAIPSPPPSLYIRAATLAHIPTWVACFLTPACAFAAFDPALPCGLQFADARCLPAARLLPACCLPAAHPLPALLCSTVALLLHAFVSVSCQCGFSVELIPTLPSSCLHLLSPACSLPCLSRRIVHCSACVTPVQ